MPRWRPLPEELDPQIREFTGQLRRVVERSGLSVATIADRTGYSKSSWERYLGGRLLPPRGATHAFADVTGTDVGHLETMWDLAERAWSRSEMRHDVTMGAIQIAQARAALGESGDEPAKGRKRGRDRDQDKNRDRNRNKDRDRDGVEKGEGDREEEQAPRGQQPSDDDTAMLRARPLPGQGPPGEPRVDPASWGAAREASAQAARTPVNGRGTAADPGHAGAEPGARAVPGRRRAAMLVAGAVAALAVIGVAALVFGLPAGDGHTAAAPTSSPSTAAHLPAGVKCRSGDCSGKDPEKMGCGGRHVTTTTSTTVGGSVVEVRYSKICRTAWGRITGAAQGDTLKISAAGKAQSDKVDATRDTYTGMVPVSSATQARACATLLAGTTACTDDGSATPTATDSP